MNQTELFLGLYDANVYLSNELFARIGCLKEGFDIHEYAAHVRSGGPERVVPGPLRVTEVALGHALGIPYPGQPALTIRFPRHGDLKNSKTLLVEIGLHEGRKNTLHFVAQERVTLKPGWPARLRELIESMLPAASAYRQKQLEENGARQAAQKACADFGEELAKRYPAIFSSGAADVLRGDGGLPGATKLGLVIQGQTVDEVAGKIEKLMAAGCAIYMTGTLKL